MNIHVNSDKTIDVDANLTQLVESDVSRVLDRFVKKLTRVEIHLSDIDNKKTGQADKRCLIEVRPTGARPLTASATSTKTELAVSEALGKMQRSLTTFFGRKGRPAVELTAAIPAPKKAAVIKAITEKKGAKKRTVAKKAAVAKAKKLSPRGPKKKMIYQARRKSRTAR